MHSLHPWSTFPKNLDSNTTRSLSMLFILQSILSSFELLHAAKELPFSSIDKLYYYSEILLEASTVEEETILLILGKMRNKILKIKSQFISWKKNPSLQDEILCKIETILCELKRKFCSFFSALTPFFIELRKNENVLFYLIEQKERLNLFLGPRTVELLLKQLFPSGPSELRAVLQKQYAERGFSLFYAQKESLINDLQWEPSSCQTPP